MAIDLPTVAQIREIPATLTADVTEREIDANGHMNVVYYLRHNIVAADALLRTIGLDDNYRAERRLGLFTTEHHLRYHSELRLGDSLAVHSRVLERSAKAVHMMAFLVDERRDRLANTLEILLVHVDLEQRRSAPIPDDLAAALDDLIAASGKLEWEAPVTGVMGIRQPS
ncbi:thioesterase family protein [Nocardia sp. NPDC057353]|uniref:thioesterase family protein n=1 Tax=Nocardia sp. NPDC057353 TaxID=3346104 RepID=UPI0036445A2D